MWHMICSRDFSFPRTSAYESDVSDIVILVTLWWWLISDVGGRIIVLAFFFRYVGDFLYVLNRSPTFWIGHQHLKLVTNRFNLTRLYTHLCVSLVHFNFSHSNIILFLIVKIQVFFSFFLVWLQSDHVVKYISIENRDFSRSDFS